ncbi:MAG: Urocanate hydratase [Candidatus Dichloromethanomonas elyunquensis]|nr:MAG: Urocanate hydratase [Candidatus Dichloromethanomonas elyunquensis]
MLENCLDPDIAKLPNEFIVYGGTGRAVRDYESLHRIKDALRSLEDNETLLIQSGKPVGIFLTNRMAPRVLMSGTMLVPKWCTWETYFELAKKNLTTFGQSTAASWSYIGTQGIMQGTWETFKQVSMEHFAGTLSGKLILTSGLGEMGSAQPIAVTANGGVCLVVDVDKQVVKKRLHTSMIDIMAESLDEALDYIQDFVQRKEPLSIGLVGNAADIYEQILTRSIKPDVVTDQTPAHDVYNSYIPTGVKPEEAASLRESNPEHYEQLIRITLARHLKTMISFMKKGSVVFDYGNNIRGAAKKAGVIDAFCFPNFITKYLRPLFCEGRGPFRWIALSGDPEDIYKTDDVILKLFPYDQKLREWVEFVQQRFTFHGLPARVCWLNFEERPLFGQVINEMVRSGKLSAPIAITRDHMDAGSVASPYRETEKMLDGSDAIADWPVLNALLNASCGATLVGIYQGGGVGIGYSIHSGMSIIADGSETAQEKLNLVLKWDPGLGIVRYADAGYPVARKNLRQKGFKIPGNEGTSYD